MTRKVYCDYLRIIATIAVITIHLSAQNWYCSDVNSVEWKTFNMYDSIVRWAVPVFVMISGALFLNRDIPLKKIYSKYVLRMVVTYLFWGLFYSISTYCFSADGIDIKGLLIATLSGKYHMWFILMIIGLYLCIPIYKKIVEDKLITRYYLVIAFVFASLIPWLIKLATDYWSSTHEFCVAFIGVFESNITTMNIHSVLGYGFYFVLGYYLDGIELSKNKRRLIYFIGILGAFFTVWVNQSLSIREQQACDRYYDYLGVNVVFEAVGIFVLLKQFKYNNDKLNSLIEKVSSYTFGIYLIHVFLIDMLSSKFNINTLSFNPIISIPGIAIIIFGASLVLILIIKKIPLLNRYIV